MRTHFILLIWLRNDEGCGSSVEHDLNVVTVDDSLDVDHLGRFGLVYFEHSVVTHHHYIHLRGKQQNTSQTTEEIIGSKVQTRYQTQVE